MRNITKTLRAMTRFEKIWFAIFSVVIMATTIYFSATSTKWTDPWSIILNWIISPVSAITGVICVVMCAKGHISNYWWGLINSITYGILALVAGYYGDWMINWFYFIPTQVLIYVAWKKNTDSDGFAVKKKLSWTGRSIMTILGIGLIVGLTLVLDGVNSWFINALKRNVTVYGNLEAMFGWKYLGPTLDASTVVLQIFAEILLILRFAEQWPLWFATNVASILIWGSVIITDPTSLSYAVPTLVMWIAFLANSIYGTISWYRRK